MRPFQAISTGFRRAFVFSGRASRPEFWWFAPLAVFVPIAAHSISKTFLGKDYKTIEGMLAVFLGFVPLFAAGFRRLQDTGTDGSRIFLPIAPFAYFLVSLILWELGFDAILGGIPLIIAFVIVGVYWLIFPVVLLVSALWIGPVVGHLILPSQPGRNRFGPEPAGMAR